MSDIVIIVEGGLVQDVYSEDGRGFVVVDGDAQDRGPYTCSYPGKTRDQIPPWAAHRLRLEGVVKREFEVGDRVRLVKRTEVDRPNRGPAADAIGTIRTVRMVASLPFGVEFDNPVKEGHGLAGTVVKWKHGWYCGAENLELVEQDFQAETVGWIQALEETLSKNHQRITDLCEIAGAHVRSLERRIEKLEKEKGNEVAD